MKCPKCGNESKETKFCGACGEKLIDNMNDVIYNRLNIEYKKMKLETRNYHKFPSKLVSIIDD